jgi:hypothetical protein
MGCQVFFDLYTFGLLHIEGDGHCEAGPLKEQCPMPLFQRHSDQPESGLVVGFNGAPELFKRWRFSAYWWGQLT